MMHTVHSQDEFPIRVLFYDLVQKENVVELHCAKPLNLLCNTETKASIKPFTPELKKCILPTFQKAIVWVM